ncbi:hypothetical protein T484DRAFT_2764237, partial [Baffinella frigidus]
MPPLSAPRAPPVPRLPATSRRPLCALRAVLSRRTSPPKTRSARKDSSPSLKTKTRPTQSLEENKQPPEDSQPGKRVNDGRFHRHRCLAGLDQPPRPNCAPTPRLCRRPGPHRPRQPSLPASLRHRANAAALPPAARPRRGHGHGRHGHRDGVRRHPPALSPNLPGVGGGGVGRGLLACCLSFSGEREEAFRRVVSSNRVRDLNTKPIKSFPAT